MLKRALLLLFLVVLSAAAAAAERAVILVMGDSLSAGYGLAADEGWVALLQARLQQKGYGYRIVNASVSGETTRGGRARLPRALAMQRPDIVIIELGGNDGLRALPIPELRANLEAMIEASREAGARVLLTGIHIPPNYGPQYTERFHAVYGDLAAGGAAVLVPHLLEGVALDPRLMQPDGIHPTAEAQPLILANIWERLQPMLVDAASEAGRLTAP